MINYHDWLNARESSALTRARNAFLWGTGVPRADLMSRSTPIPATFEKIKKEIEPNLVPSQIKKKTSKKKKHHKKKN